MVYELCGCVFVMNEKLENMTGMMQDFRWMIQAELSVQITKSRQYIYFAKDCFVLHQVSLRFWQLRASCVNGKYYRTIMSSSSFYNFERRPFQICILFCIFQEESGLFFEQFAECCKCSWSRDRGWRIDCQDSQRSLSMCKWLEY